MVYAKRPEPLPSRRIHPEKGVPMGPGGGHPRSSSPAVALRGGSQKAREQHTGVIPASRPPQISAPPLPAAGPGSERRRGGGGDTYKRQRCPRSPLGEKDPPRGTPPAQCGPAPGGMRSAGRGPAENKTRQTKG